MESEMLSGTAQKAERRVEWGKTVLLAQASQPRVRETPKAVSYVSREKIVRVTRAGITVHSCEHPQPTTQPQLHCESPT